MDKTSWTTSHEEYYDKKLRGLPPYYIQTVGTIAYALLFLTVLGWELTIWKVLVVFVLAAIPFCVVLGYFRKKYSKQ